MRSDRNRGGQFPDAYQDSLLNASFSAEAYDDQAIPWSSSNPQAFHNQQQQYQDQYGLDPDVAFSSNNYDYQYIDPSQHHLDVEPSKTLWQRIWSREALKVLFWCTGGILGAVVQNVYLAESGKKLRQYPYFIYWSTTIPFNLIFGIALAGVMCFTDQITYQMRRISQYKFATIGFLNAINGLLLLFSNPHVPGPIQALLGPTVVTIPLTMIVCFIFLGHRYNWKHLVSVLIIAGGVFLAFYPSIFSDYPSDVAGTPYWNGLWLLGSVPLVLAAVWEEKLFGSEQVHVIYMVALSMMWQTLFVALSFPVDAIPGFGTSSSIKEIFTHQHEALRCLARQDISDLCPDCDCDQAWWNLLLFVVGYLMTNFFQVGVVKYCGATFFYVVSTLVVPLTEFAFSWKALLGDDAVALHKYNYLALGVLVIGMPLFRMAGRATLRDNSQEFGYYTQDGFAPAVEDPSLLQHNVHVNSQFEPHYIQSYE